MDINNCNGFKKLSCHDFFPLFVIIKNLSDKELKDESLVSEFCRNILMQYHGQKMKIILSKSSEKIVFQIEKEI